ncbi:ABC transporter ATP-binding protein [Bradyrhizobium sp. 61]|nr:ABC transporter ATP-binding protein [Bradyrhizobium sp. 61]MCK1441679.1 ABC transporter ATP-binding protein [Bradyrhizobium sp. 48]MCK1465221.1 ABC transporter ATP-binding protein [Bradyrhizobium sp. 2]
MSPVLQKSPTRATDLLAIEHLSIAFTTSRGRLQAVNDVSLTVASGETLALVGESGCGKSTLGRAIMGIVPPSSGAVRLEGIDLVPLGRSARLPYRRAVQMIFQDPFGSLNPRQRVGDIIADPLRVHRFGNRKEIRARVLELLDLVGLPAAAAARYPHEFSGGQRQRIGIARALAPKPDLIICDEPVSALDVSIQAQILNLLADLRDELGVSYLFISHDLAVVEFLADRVAVMYLGRIVEIAPRGDLFARPAHPYTRALLDAVPRIETRKASPGPRPVQGDVPSPYAVPAGCAFQARCPRAREICRGETPALETVATGHAVACFFP